MLIFLLAVQVLKSQSCMTFQETEKNNISIKHLDSLYLNATASGTFAGVFNGSKKFDEAWLKFHQDLINYMAKRGIKWEKPQNCFNKIYFEADGKVAYWFFNFPKADNVPADVQEKYRNSINEFSKTEKLKIKSEAKFSQCVTVTLMEL